MEPTDTPALAAVSGMASAVLPLGTAVALLITAELDGESFSTELLIIDQKLTLQ